MTMTLAIKRAKGAPTISMTNTYADVDGEVVVKEVVNASIFEHTESFPVFSFELGLQENRGLEASESCNLRHSRHERLRRVAGSREQ